MEKLVLLRFPASDVRVIESMVRNADCFVALITGDLYQIGQHLVEDDFEFTAMLDRNVYTRIAALVSDSPIPADQLHDHRIAAAILAFSQLAEITFDYHSSLYEYASSKGGTEALKELRRFRHADNLPTGDVINFALGRTDQIASDKPPGLDDEIKAPPASEFERTTFPNGFNYTFALKIAELSQLEIPNVQKMLIFLDWMEFEFLHGGPATLFANRYFSPSRFGKMLKGISRRGVMNAAWDMTLIQDWRKRALAGLKINKPVILISRDRAVRSIAPLITAETTQEFKETIRSPWGRNSPEGKLVLQRYLELHSRGEAGDKTNRKMPDVEARKVIMRELEERLFGN